ncbi:MAG: DUF4139 domain-containing protein, partial [Deltaproteobacteria bacterium]|nr:DUF4139 domain-containing protein [Deltaproteobacteria bacterium]
ERTYLSVMEVPERPQGEEGQPPPASPVSARVVLEQFVDDAIGERLTRARALRLDLEPLDEQISELRDRLRRGSSAREIKPHELRKTIVAKLICEGEAPTRARLRVDYHVPGARWAPAYQCHLSRDCQRAEVVLRALVAQASGEDWRGVRLSLSTAAPLVWTELPELTSIRIGRAQPPAPSRRGFRPPPRGAASLFADLDRERHAALKELPSASPWIAPTLKAASPEGLVPDPGVVEEGLFHCAANITVPAPEVLDVEEAFDEEAFDEEIFPEEADYDEEVSPAYNESVDAVMATQPKVSRKKVAMSPGSAPAPSFSMPPSPSRAPSSQATNLMRAAAPTRRRRPSVLRTREVAALVDDYLTAGSAVSTMAFSQLRLGGLDDLDKRARLQPIDTRAAYLETLLRANVEVHVDVVAVVNEAQQRAADVAALPPPAGTSDVRRAAGTFDYAYIADAAVDVESDGAFHSVALGARVAESDVTYVIVPREDPHAYRKASLKNPLDAPLLPGPAEVHVGGDYVLTTTLPLVAPQGEFSLGLGVEQALKVARNTTFEERRRGEKVVAMTELLHGIEIDVQNHLSRPARCEVRERIPQADENAEVVVEEVKVEPSWEPFDQREERRLLRGGRRWRIDIGSGEKKTLRASYVVKIYANNELVDGNRREV